MFSSWCLVWLAWLVQLVAWPASTFAVLAHCQYHTRSASFAAYHNNTHCPYHFRLQEYVLLTLFFMLFRQW